MQAQETCRALLDRGVNVQMFNWMDATQADLYHFIGFPHYLGTIAKLVRQAGKPYVCTVLTGGLSHPWQLLKARTKLAIEQHLRIGSGHGEALRHAAAIITIIPRDALGLARLLKIPVEHIHVVNNGIDARFTKATPDPWRSSFGPEAFVLCAGAIQRRKHQLLLAETCNRLGLPLVLLGPVLPGQSDYGCRVAQTMEVNAARFGGRWVRDLTHDNPLLASAFAACRIFVLLSENETQPLSVLQAMALRKPVLLGKADYSNDEPFRALSSVAIHRPELVAPALLEMWVRGAPSSLPAEYTWTAVADSLKDIYERVLT